MHQLLCVYLKNIALFVWHSIRLSESDTQIRTVYGHMGSGLCIENKWIK
jgi:hypothetical protein